jgi:diguanylate cyclase (GGDEF)-like protein
MDKNQPNLEKQVANQILYKLPYAAMLSDEAGKIVWCNEALTHLIKANVSDIVGQSKLELENLYFNPLAEQADLLTVLDTDSGEPRQWLRKQETVLDGMTLTVYDDVTTTIGLNSKIEELQNQLNELSTVDPVSGLLNRRAMMLNLEPLVSRSRRYNNPLSIIAMDLLNLDAVQQQHGQQAVHHVVKQVSFMLKDILRWADLVSHLDDNRFVFILPETEKQAAVQLAHKINTHIDDMNIDYENTPLQVRASFGVAAWEKGNDVVLLLRHANQSLELAKQSGPGSVQDC